MGRTDDMLIVRGVNVFPSQVEAALLKGGEVEPHYQIIVDRGLDHTDEIEVLVEVSEERISSPDQLADLQRKLAHEVQTILGISCKLQIVGPKQIQRSEGKAVRVVDRRSL